MKYLLIAILILLPVIYLNRSYAYFYNFQGSHFIGNPSYQSPRMFTTAPGAEIKKLVTLGDSLMAGTGSSGKENSLAYLIADNLAKTENVELFNLAFPGVGVEDVYVRQVAEAVEQKPDYIVLMIGTNDVHNQMSEADFSDYYQRILDFLTKKTTAKITVINIPFIGSDKILLPPWDIVINSRISKFNEIIKKTSLGYNLEVVDLNTQFKNQFKKSSDLYSADQFHPSDKGYKLWGEYINKFVVSQ